MPVVRKSEFAEMCNVSKGRVTQWLTAGLIDGTIGGEGRSAAIDVDIAQAQLKERRAVNESCGLNGLNTKLDGVHPQPPRVDVVETVGDNHSLRVGSAAPAAPANHEDAETVDARIKAEKLKQNEILTRKQEMEELTRHGKWMVAADVTCEMNRLSSEMIRIFEGCFPDLASAIAVKFQVSQREVLHLLRGEFRQAREQLVATRKAAAAKGE